MTGKLLRRTTTICGTVKHRTSVSAVQRRGSAQEVYFIAFFCRAKVQ